jgi:hypothetical protein
MESGAKNVVSDELWGQNGQNCVSGDDFFVDNLLDFSEACPEEETEQQPKEDKSSGVLTVLPLPEPKNTFSAPESELCLPVDDLADLEWLSNFVDDSFTGYSLTVPATKFPEIKSKPVVPVPENKTVFPVQTKARSKRARTGGRIWSLGSPGLTESSTTSSSSSSSCTSSSLPWVIYTDDLFLKKPPVTKPKKKTASDGGDAAQPRRCSHCHVQKTPQWRTGPNGAKTLCNACGVRFKSGRLLPEYRPACSPTFSSEVHSNNHRKVLEMRRKKEGETGSDYPVQSF